MATKEAQAMHVDELDSKQQIKLIMLRRSFVGWLVGRSIVTMNLFLGWGEFY